MSKSASNTNNSSLETSPSRRGIMGGVMALITSAVAILAPLGAGVYSFFAPLTRKKNDGDVKMIPIASLAEVPPDGVPRRFVVIDEREDAWSRYPPAPIGAVFLRRTSEEEPPRAVSAECPHLGCAVDFRLALARYRCPCHNSAWEPDGERVDPEKSPSPRSLDELPVEVRDGMVLVGFQRFRNAVETQQPI